jgi:hypothetical protein
MFNVPTPELTKLLVQHLTNLGFPGVTSEERWEGDGVFVVGPPPRDPNVHWYLWASGSDNSMYPFGVSLVLIGDNSEAWDGDDEVIEVESLEHLARVLTDNGYLPIR